MSVRGFRTLLAFHQFRFNFSPFSVISQNAVTHQNVFLRYSSSQSHIVQMRGLDYETTKQDVIDFFKPLGIIPKNINLKCDGGGRTASISEVEFNTHAEAVVAMRKKNAFIGNRFIRLALKSTDVRSDEEKQMENQNLQSSGKIDLNIDAAAKESTLPAVHCLRMKNAPWRITDQAIYDFFWPVGAHPISIKPIYNESGLRTGEFDVLFLSHNEVCKAMAKNNAYLGNKFVQLSFKQS